MFAFTRLLVAAAAFLGAASAALCAPASDLRDGVGIAKRDDTGIAERDGTGIAERDGAGIAERGSVTIAVRGNDGTPLAHARVTLGSPRGGRGERSTRGLAVDRDGTLTIAALAPGTYAISADAPGYAHLDAHPLAVRAGHATEVALMLSRSATSLTTIGSVTTAGTATVSTSTAPSQTLRAQDFAARGYTRVSDLLADELSTTVIRAGSGSAAAPRTVALRGPDPTETLVDVDGHEINSGVTGDFDLSLLDPADFESVQLVYGIAPSALVGPSTIGGAINVRTLEPTATPHGLVRLTGGSFGEFAQTLQATGTSDRIGYALSLHRAFSANDVSNATVSNAGGTSALVGSDVASQTSLAKVRYAFGAARAGYAELTFRDQSVGRDLSAALTSLVGPDAFALSPDSRMLGHNAGYGFDLHVPLDADRATGTPRTNALYRHLTSYASQSVQGGAANLNPNYFNDRDRIDDDTLELDRSFATSTLTLKYRLRTERLDTFDPTRGNVNDQSVARALAMPLATAATSTAPAQAATVGGPAQAAAAGGPAQTATVGGLAQTQHSLALRYAYDPTPQWHYTIAAYASAFSAFGRSLDPRAGVVFTPSARTAIRASAGTTFQSPQLVELYVPATLPQPDANGHISVGNPNLKADHATEYDLGFEQLFGDRAHATRASLDLYRTNVRTPSQRLLPAATCAGASTLACASFPVNLGNATYTGAEFRIEREIAPATMIRVAYGVDSTYADNVPPGVQNGSLVPREQFLGVPLNKSSVALEHRPDAGISYDASLAYEGRYNELDRGAFATLRASVGYAAHGYDIRVAADNLTNVYATHFTQAGAGVPYGGNAGPIATDAYALPSRTVSVSVARRF